MPLRPPVITEARRFDAFGKPGTSGDVRLSLVNFRTSPTNMFAFSVNSHYKIAWTMVSAIMTAYGYYVDITQTGFYNYRHIGNDPNKPWSAHAWATAGDFNWRQNPDGGRLITDMPGAMLSEIMSIETASGAPVYRWGGDWDRDPSTGHSYYDAMHIEGIAHPLDLATGLKQQAQGEDMLSIGSRSHAVWRFQAFLNRERSVRPNPPTTWKVLEIDGIFGKGTEEAVKAFQHTQGLGETGMIDSITAALLSVNSNQGYRLTLPSIRKEFATKKEVASIKVPAAPDLSEYIKRGEDVTLT